ncbi:MAG: hypothetical protein IPL46_21415 [Saprospiraceae bacterium]|nr:hypothetical protein [Saprospiraceae bacterium]
MVASDGVEGLWSARKPGGGFPMGCTSWGDGAACGFAGSAGPGLALTVTSCAANILSAVGPNCRNVNASLDINGNTLFNLSDIITNFPAAAPAKVTISRSFGTPVFGPATVYTGTIIFNACRYIDETLAITVETQGGTCWSNLTFKQLNAPKVDGRNYTVYCFDKFAKTPDLTDRPSAYIPCQAPFDAAYVTDWIVPYDCEPGVQDTVKVILREWEAYDKKGRRGFAYDTIVVLQFGQIDSSHIYCTEKDTLYCTDTTKRIGPFITYEDVDLSCDTLWLVNISDKDNDGMLEFNPAVLDNKCGLNVYVNSYKVHGECGNLYRISVDLKQNCYGPADLICQVSPPAGTSPNMARQVSPGYWRCEFWLYDLDTVGPDLYCKAVDLFSGPLSINHWSVVANPNSDPVIGSYFDPYKTIDKSGLPYQLKINSYFDPTPILDIDGNQSLNGLDSYSQDAELT